MQSLVLALMLLVSVNFMLKQTFLPWKYVFVVAVVAALFVGFSWPWAVEQNKLQIAAWLCSPSMMADTAVLLTMEVALQMAFCIVEVRWRDRKEISRWDKMVTGFLRYFTGLLFFAVLFSLMVTLVFALPGVSFTLISWSLAGMVLLLVPAFVWLVKFILPENRLRLELLFMLNILIAGLGIVATVNGRTAIEGTNSVNWTTLAALLALILAVAAIGLFSGKIIKRPWGKIFIRLKNKLQIS